MRATASSAASIPPSSIRGAEIATRLILEICGGEASELVIAGQEPDWHRTLTLRPTRVLDLGGVDVPVPEQVRILEALGFGVTTRDDGVMDVSIPSWRADIDGRSGSGGRGAAGLRLRPYPGDPAAAHLGRSPEPRPDT